MREILLYDPKRVPRQWTALIRPGQYAVFLSDVESSAPLSCNGTQVSSSAEYFCLMFDTLPGAETYCREAVRKIRGLKCEVFDSVGRVNPPVAIIVNEESAHTLDSEASARRLVRWGLVAIGISLPLFWYAWKSGAAEVWWPVLLGINMVAAGLRLIQWGFGLKEELRYRQKEAAVRLHQSSARKEATESDSHPSGPAKRGAPQ